MALSSRLNAVAELIPNCHCLADIGCDHGYLTAFALANRQIDKVIATDISLPSLQKTRNLVQSDKLQTRHGDGLSVLSKGDGVDCMLFCGMGGINIVNMLTSGMEIFRSSELILQPQNNIMRVRQFLSDNSIKIIAEKTVFDRGKYYTIIVANGKTEDKLTDMQILFGRFYDIYNEELLKHFESQRDKLKKYVRKSKENEEKYNMLEEVIKCQLQSKTQ